MCGIGCNGGSGTSGKGRNHYTPKNSNNNQYKSRAVSTGSRTKDGVQSRYGKPAVRASFGKKK